jgi:hypothetical protein
MADHLVTVARFRALPEAGAAKFQLETEGLRAGGGVEQAADVLREVRARWREGIETSAGSESFVCLACGVAMPAEASKCAVCGWSYASNENN